MLFVIPVIINLPGHRFEIYTLISEICDNADVVLGIRNVCEMEELINTRGSCVHLLSNLIPFFPKIDMILKPKDQKFIPIYVPLLMNYQEWP